MADNYWMNFLNTGSVFDYLKYKEQEQVKADENLHQGLGNQRTDDRGE